MNDKLGPMPEIAVTVNSPVANKVHAAVMYTCHCGNSSFGLFRLMGHPLDHVHRQCIACGASYCPGGKCPDVPAWAEIDPSEPIEPQLRKAADRDGYDVVPPPGDAKEGA
jgi:hypothetical protein